MEDRLAQQLKKGVLEMLVLELVCRKATYGYELLQRLKEGSEGLFQLKEGTLYPILYRLEDDGLIESRWSQGEGRAAPKKIYSATDRGRQARLRRQLIWVEFKKTVDSFYEGGNES
ncbi:MAG: PadR family transcriptional regulator [Oscillospiraceae bacterium]|nr:PadR family transcriptional regulator [Oscillospiraceae bacterium]